MKWKIILKFELHNARYHRNLRPERKRIKPLNEVIRPLLKELGLKQTKAESWCSDEVSLEAAAETLPKILGYFADPRSAENTSGELGYLLLYIERL